MREVTFVRMWIKKLLKWNYVIVCVWGGVRFVCVCYWIDVIQTEVNVQNAKENTKKKPHVNGSRSERRKKPADVNTGKPVYTCN